MGILNVPLVRSRNYEVVSSDPDTLTICDVDETAELHYTLGKSGGGLSVKSYTCRF